MVKSTALASATNDVDRLVGAGPLITLSIHELNADTRIAPETSP